MDPISTPFFIIAGPTAVGKSALAVAVAEQCAGEIVGADAFQVYRGLDLLTAKPSPEVRARVPHHLISEIPLTQSFNVAQYLERARQHLADIHARGHRAIVVGGTGLYLRALTRGLADLPGADAELRAELQNLALPELLSRLARLDPVGAATIDSRNPRRLIRAIEVCQLTGRPFSSFRNQWTDSAIPHRGVALSLDRAALHTRIDLRTEAMFANGVIGEVQNCGETGPTAGQTLGLREIRALLAGELDHATCLATIQQSTRRYAKRQTTWLRREASLQELPLPGDADFRHLIAPLVKAILHPNRLLSRGETPGS